MPTLLQQGAQRPPLGIFLFSGENQTLSKASARPERSGAREPEWAKACAGSPLTFASPDNEETSGGCSPKYRT